ncbi:MAG TPA: ATP-binding protein [Thermoanaerobaculia bacterium]
MRSLPSFSQGAAARPAWLRYGASAALVVLVFALKTAFPEALGRSTPFLLFPFAVMVAAWFGGFGPGLLATFLSVGITFAFFLEAPFSEPASAAVRLAAALLQGLGVSWMAHALRRSTDQGREDSFVANSILENMEDAFFLLDRDWRFLYVGRHFAERYSRVPVEEMLGRTLWDVYPEMRGSVLEKKYREAMETGTTIRFETRSLISHRWFLTRAHPVGGGLAVFASDLTDRKQAEEALQAAKEEAERRSLQLQDLAQAGLEVNAAGSIEQALQIVTDRAREIIGAHQGGASLILDQNWAQAVNAVSLSDKYAEYRSYDGRPEGESIYSLVCRSNRPLRMTQSELEAHEVWKGFGREAPRHPPMRGLLAAPLTARDGRNLGLIQLSDPYEGEFTDSDEAVLVQLAQTASVAIENAWLFQTAQQAREAAETANTVKDQFLAILSHELRTPLNAILGWAQLLRNRRPDEPGLDRGLEAIERNARSQTQLIDDLLDISRIASGRLRLEPRLLDPADPIEAALSAVLPSADAKGIRLGRSLEPRPGLVLGDPGRLQQVFVNLLSNAVKFTPSGGRVDVSLERMEERALVRVTDTGQGIAPEFLPHVFDSFRQADASTTRRQGGLGLGLSIVRQLVTLHGGSVDAESPGVGKGSTFTVALHLALQDRKPEPTDGKEKAAADSEPRPPLDGLRVLAVDDDLDTLEMMSELLSLRGAEVQSAGSADEAISTLSRFAPDVLVSDISMPGRDGYELIRDIRSRGWSPETLPAVAVTALASSEDRRRALDAGYQVHLGKPVDPAELTSILVSLGRQAPPS